MSLGRFAHTERDFAESLRWFSRAADSGHVRSLYWIGKHHWFGQHVAQNRKEAMSFFHLEADNNVIAARRILKFLSRRRNAKEHP